MTPHPITPRKRGNSHGLLLTLAYVSFVSLGLPDGLLGVAWPSIRADFHLDLDALGALLLTVTAGYAVSSLAAPALAARHGVGGLLGFSTALTAVSLIGYALSPAWAVMVLIGLLAGAGGGAIDATLNAHAAAHYSYRRINLLHAFFGVGTTVGPLIMTSVIVRQWSWQWGYVVVAAAQLVLVVCFAMTRRLWPSVTRSSEAGPVSASLLDTLKLPTTKLSVITFFMYVGLESSTGVWMFSLLHEGMGFGMGFAGLAVSVYWGGLLLGRFAYALLRLPLAPDTVLTICMAFAAAATAIVALHPLEPITFAAVAVVGMAAGPIFPLLIATTPGRVGADHSANSVGMQVSLSAVGAAVFPAGAGLVAGVWGLAALPVGLAGLWLALLCVHTRLRQVCARATGPTADQMRGQVVARDDAHTTSHSAG